MGFDAILLTDTAKYPQWTRGYGAHRIASHLREHNFSVLVIDFCSSMTFDIWTSICKNAIGKNTKILGMSTTWLPYRTPKNDLVTELADFSLRKDDSVPENTFVFEVANGRYAPWLNVAKNLNNNIKIVVGGPKIDFYQDFPADHFVKGLGETQILDILQNRILPRLVDHDTEAKNNWSWNDSRTSYTELDFIKNKEQLTLETSRGCRFRCAFCSYPLIGQKNMMNFMKSKESLYTELLENYERYNITHYTVADDTLNDSTEKLQYLLDVTRRLPFKLNLWAYVRLDVIAVHPQQIEMLKELGIGYSWIGIDSFHPKASKIIGKGMDSNRKKDTLYKIRESWGNDTEIVTSYIVGLPYEDKEDVLSSNEWLIHKDSPVDHASFIPLRLNPVGPLPNVDRSLIDVNYKEYGYQVKDMNEFWNWTKDNSNIKSFTEANVIADEINLQWSNRPKYRKINYPEINFVEDPISEYFNPLIESLEKRNVL